MAKRAKTKKYTAPTSKSAKVEEPVAEYKPAKKVPLLEELPFRRFERIAAQVPFTQKEWSNILHLSERTLQRYAKDKSSFEGIYSDRILHIEELIKIGLETFTDSNALYHWLKKEKQVLGETLNFGSLYSTRGIENLIDQLGRIQWGVYT